MKLFKAPFGASATPLPTRATYRPSRKVVSRKTQTPKGYFASVRTGLSFPWESQLEYDFQCITEADPRVTEFYAQPAELAYDLDDGPHLYHPDFLIRRADGSIQIVEVKYAEDAAEPENIRRFGVIHQVYARRGMAFEVVTEISIRRQPRLANSQLLRDGRWHPPSRQLQFRVQEAFSDQIPTTIDELERALGFGPERRREIFGLALRGHLAIDLDAGPLSGMSPITRVIRNINKGGKHDIN